MEAVASLTKEGAKAAVNKWAHWSSQASGLSLDSTQTLEIAKLPMPP